MVRVIFGILLIAIIGFGIYCAVNYQFETQWENGKFSYVKISPRLGRPPAGVADGSTFEPPARPLRPSFRIATFNMGGMDENKLNMMRISDVLVRLLPQFELIALEGVRGKNQGVLLRLVEMMNTASGRQYDFATRPTQKRDGVEYYSAFVFDRTAFEIDRSMVHFVEDPLGRFRHKPLVGAFRVRGLEPTQAFTFTLVAVETNPENPGPELDLLADVYRAVRDDGRNEDDIIMLGDFQTDETHFGRLGQLMGITAAITNAPTTVRGTQLVDNIIFDRRATSEFTGRAGVVDLMRDFELTMQQAQEISEHLPIWAEFSSFEGGQKGFVPSISTPQPAQ